MGFRLLLLRDACPSERTRVLQRDTCPPPGTFLGLCDKTSEVPGNKLAFGFVGLFSIFHRTLQTSVKMFDVITGVKDARSSARWRQRSAGPGPVKTTFRGLFCRLLF